LRHAFLYSDGNVRDLGALARSGAMGVSHGVAVNASGHVAGDSTTDDGVHAFLWDGVMHDLGAASNVAGLNDSDVVVGTIGPDSNSFA